MLSFACCRALSRRIVLVACLALLTLVQACSRGATKPASTIAAPDREVLAQYEVVRAALADDDARKAHVAGEKLWKALEVPEVSPGLTKAKASAKQLSEALRIENLRVAFKDFSVAVVPFCKGVEGFYVVSTDLMPDGVWVQTSPVVGNPYLGRSMALYGEVK